MTVVADSVTTVALPVGGRALPPVVARKLGRLALTYALFWVMGAMPGFLGLNDSWVAAGLGLDLRFFTVDFATYGEELSKNVGGLQDRRLAIKIAFQI
jgi:hypothetical protein